MKNTYLLFLIFSCLYLGVTAQPYAGHYGEHYCAHQNFDLTDLHQVGEGRSNPSAPVISFIDDVAVVLEYNSVYDVHTMPDTINYPNIKAQPANFDFFTILQDLQTVVAGESYDFVLLYSLHEVPGWIHSGSRFFRPAKNIGFPNSNTGNNNPLPGWKTLRGTPHMNDAAFLDRTSTNHPNYGSTLTAFHEMMHFWGVFYTGNLSPGPRDWLPGDPVSWLAQSSYHWTWVWDDLPDFDLPGIMYSGPTENRYNAIDLYTMGLMDYTEANSFVYSVYDYNNPDDHYSLTLDSMIYGLSLLGTDFYEGNGRRIPATDPTAENMNVLIVVVKGQDEILTTEDENLILNLANDFSADWQTATWGRSQAQVYVQPACVSLTSPIAGEDNVSVSTILSWEESPAADGYRLTLGTTPGGGELVNDMDVGNVITYDPGLLPDGTMLYLTISPYNSGSEATVCQIDSFTTAFPCRYRDSLALVTLYHDNIGSNWTNVWDLDQPLESWYGVHLNSNGCVICLDLDGLDDCVLSNGQGNGLIGVLSEGVTTLSELEVLSLGNNQLSGPILPGLGDLTQLRRLSLANNQFTGPIPSALTNLSDITHLFAQNNRLSDCFEEVLDPLCALGFSPDINDPGYNFTGNSGLPGGGDFQAFCNTGAGTCTLACTNLIYPLDGATDVDPEITLSWSSVPGATGYKVDLRISDGDGELYDVGNATTFYVGTLMPSLMADVTIIPYNANGDATGCVTESFTIADCVDLIVSNVMIDNFDGNTLTYTVTAKNIGLGVVNFNGTLPHVSLQAWASMNDQLEFGDPAIDEYLIFNESLSPGEELSHTFHTSIDLATYPYLILQIDASEIVFECDEINNITKLALNLGCTDPNAHNYDPNAAIDNSSCATCTDGIQNGDEIDVDCGGILCDPCFCHTMVTNTNDIGSGSLREAIICANNTPGKDTIRFALPGAGPHVFSPITNWPDIIDSLVIDATTQASYTAGTIIIDGSSGATSGLQIYADNSEIYGIYARNFASSGFVIYDANNCILGSTDKPNYSTNNFYGLFLGRGVQSYDNEIIGNFFGLNPQGHSEPNTYGMTIFGSSNNLLSENTFANNSGGVFYNGGGNGGNKFLNNSFYCNSNPFAGPDGQNNVPVIGSATTSIIQGTSDPNETIQVFQIYADACSQACQGRYLLGTTTADAGGNWSLNAPFPLALRGEEEITAIATDQTLGSSRFSTCVTVASPIPDCTVLTSPVNGAVDILIDADLTWAAASNATGYHLRAGTVSGGTDLVNDIDVGNVLTYDLGSLPYNTTIFVTITPYNTSWDALSCTEESFTTIGCLDLVIDSLSYSLGAMYARIANVGSKTADLSGVDVKFSYSPTGAPTTTYASQLQFGSFGPYLDPGESYVHAVNVDPNYNNHPYFVAEVDFFNELSECDENNNVITFALTLGCSEPNAHNYDPNVNSDDGSCETCTDGIQNGDETGVDCGGSNCTPCPGDCPDISVDQTPIPSGVFHAGNTLTSKGEVETGTEVTFKAGSNIILEAGFRAHPGSTFRAFIEPCTPEDGLAIRPPKIEDQLAVRRTLEMKIFPNPFQRETTIRYFIPKATTVDIIIWDIFGNKVVQPVSSSLQEGGEYDLQFTASDLPSGIYMVVIRAGGERQIQRMEIVR